MTSNRCNTSPSDTSSRHFRLKMFPIKNTFIHFSESFHATRCRSAPPTVKSTSTRQQQQLQRRRKKLRGRRKEADEILAMEEFARESIKERWGVLAKKLCDHSRREAKGEIDVVRLRFTLPFHLFNDWAFYTFLVLERPEAIPQLFRAGQLRHSGAGVQFWCSRRQLQEQRNPSLKVLNENAAKLLRAQAAGVFAVVFNRDVVLYHLWERSTTLSSIVTKTLKSLNSNESVIVRRRGRVLEQGTLGELGIQPGNLIAVDSLALRH